MKCDPVDVRSLRYRYVWLFGGVSLVGLVLYLTLMPAIPGPTLTNDKVAHGIAFMVLMIWFCGIFDLRFSPWVALTLLCLGISIELVQQQLTYRSAEFADGLADLAGIGIGWALAAMGLQHWATTAESWVSPHRS